MKQDKTAVLKGWREAAGYALLILPAVALGMLAMIRNSVSPALWGQQAAAWAVLALLAWLLRRAAARIPAIAWSVLLLAFLTAALFGEEVGGARRWVDLIVFHAHAAKLVLPALLVVLCCIQCPYPVLLGAAVVLSIQPDISQLAAFSAAAIPILWQHRNKKLWSMGSMLLLCALVIACMRIPVEIEPVSYCEGILGMLAEISPVLQAAGWAALSAVPLFWLVRFFGQGEAKLLSLAVYYTVSILFALSGEYPVPFMGFGLSPIAGYWLVYICSGLDKRRSA